MAQRWYIGKGETVDVLDDGNPGLSGRHVMQERSGTALSEEKRMYQSEAKLHPVVQERFVLVDDASPQVCNVRSVDPELLYNEDKLGCARGVVWALVFEAAAIAAIAICWKLRFSMR
jgi:hypothetical protein